MLMVKGSMTISRVVTRMVTHMTGMPQGLMTKTSNLLVRTIRANLTGTNEKSSNEKSAGSMSNREKNMTQMDFQKVWQFLKG